MYIDKEVLENLICKVNEIHQYQTNRSQLQETINILKSAIVLNISDSILCRLTNNINPEDLLRQTELNRVDNTTSPYKWTGTKSELVEVIESILLIGSINNGNVAKKDLYEFIGNVFQVDLSNHNNILDHIYNRKDDMTSYDRRLKYLNKLSRVLSQKLQDRDRKER